MMKNKPLLGSVFPTLFYLSFLGFVLTTPLVAQNKYKHYEMEHFDLYATSDEIANEHGKKLKTACKRFYSVFGKHHKRGAIGIETAPGKPDRDDNAKWYFPWDPNKGGAKRGIMAKAFTHEVGHIMFLKTFNEGCSKEVKKNHNNYGSYLPDWIDEAIAVYLEPEDLRKQRYRRFQKNFQNKKIPLKKLFTMNHPKIGKGGRPKRKKGNKSKVQAFYTGTLSVLEFLLDVEGNSFVQEMVSMLQKGKPMKEILRKKADNLPADLGKLEKYWVKWLKKKRF